MGLDQYVLGEGASMEHLNITFPVDLKRRLDAEAERRHTKRSTLIQLAVLVYLDLSHRTKLIASLKEGYLEMSSEANHVMKDFAKLDRDSLKYVD